MQCARGDVTWAYLKGLFAGLVRFFVYNLIVLRPWKVFMFERIKRALVKKAGGEDRRILRPCGNELHTHSQLMAICASSSMPKFLILWISPTRSM